MDKFTRKDLLKLASKQGQGLVSMFLPTHRAGRDVQQNRIQFKNLWHTATQQAEDSDPAIREQLAELRAWESDHDWWQHQAEGLAVFVDGDSVTRWRLPRAVPLTCCVGDTFAILPLCEVLQNDGQFYLLSVSQNSVRLYSGDAAELTELAPRDLPTDLRSALRIDEYVSSLQQHTASAGGTVATFHGHGGSDLDVKKQDEIKQYFQVINRALSNFLGSQRIPLLFAGVEYLFPIFKETCGYSELLETPLTGNLDHLPAGQLHKKAWPLVSPRFNQQATRLLERFHVADQAGLGLDDEQAIVTAAAQGQVETLLVLPFADRVQTMSAEYQAGIDQAIAHTLRHGGSVVTVDREQLARPIAAILRFATAEEIAS